MAVDDPRATGDPRAVLLDALGTLLELEPPGPALVDELAARHGISLSAADAAAAFGEEIAYYRRHHLEGRDEAGLAELRERCAAVLHGALPRSTASRLTPAGLLPAMLAALRFRAHPDAAPALAELRRRGARLVVVSNWDVALAGVLGRAGLGELLDAVVVSAAVGAAKPDPAIFAAALARAGVDAGHAVHVGDSPEHDLAGARAAGIAAVLLRRAGTAAATGSETAATIVSLDELPALLCDERR